MALESMKCPNCGAPLHFDNENQEYCFCSSCGTQVYKEDKHFDRKMDFKEHQASINADLERQRMANEHKEEVIAAWLCIPFTIIIVIMFIVLFHLA